MKRYLIFHWTSYEALGGFKDFKESFDDLESVRIYLNSLRKYYTDSNVFRSQVIDRNTFKEINA